MTPQTITPARVAELATALTLAAEAMTRLQSKILDSEITPDDASCTVNEMIHHLRTISQ
jgi:hypothetical protein